MKSLELMAVPAAALLLMSSILPTPGADNRLFLFGEDSAGLRGTVVTPATIYSTTMGYGFDLGSTVQSVKSKTGGASNSFCVTSARPFFFSAALPEGNYNITVILGNPVAGSTNTIKAESRRLMLENIITQPGQSVTRSFIVNVHGPKMSNGRQVGLKKRELGPPMVMHWDDKLTLEFNGTAPALASLQITPADDTTTVFLAGDSTVTDQPEEPWCGWGQMLPRFFKPGVAIANHAESGESLKSFLGSRRLDKILDSMKKGDYLFIQFGHNDQKDRSPGAGAFTTYKQNLKRYVEQCRERGGLPVLVTSMHRLRFDPDGTVPNSLGDFPEAVRQVAREEKVPLIDLNAMSKTLYEALGPDKCKKAFQDGTHHNNYGGYELARCMVEGIRKAQLPLASFLNNDLPAFDPAHPDPVDSFNMPASPMKSTVKPEGN